MTSKTRETYKNPLSQEITIVPELNCGGEQAFIYATEFLFVDGKTYRATDTLPWKTGANLKSQNQVVKDFLQQKHFLT